MVRESRLVLEPVFILSQVFKIPSRADEVPDGQRGQTLHNKQDRHDHRQGECAPRPELSWLGDGPRLMLNRRDDQVRLEAVNLPASGFAKQRQTGGIAQDGAVHSRGDQLGKPACRARGAGFGGDPLDGFTAPMPDKTAVLAGLRGKTEPAQSFMQPGRVVLMQRAQPARLSAVIGGGGGVMKRRLRHRVRL